jgi:hypothetical protein
MIGRPALGSPAVWGLIVKGIAILSAAIIALSTGVAAAQKRQTDDSRWVDQCVRDSASYAVSERIKVMYCSCMVARMSDNETRSVSQWEQANPRVRDDCARRAGWN